MSSLVASKQLLPSVINDAMVTPPSSVKRSKTKPMIVDITLNDNGEQVYKVQGTTTRSASRKRRLQEDENEDGYTKSKKTTPIRSILGTISPNTLNQDKKGVPDNQLNNSKLNGSPSVRKSDGCDDNIWSNDVEEAFEEALRMIPKNGLAKIKISGKSCGRNELISDYIIQKTGKIRTRKQVSSHIQVIKNLKKNHELIELINNGPSDPAALKKFDEVFSEISFKKSLGNAGPSPDISALKPETPISAKRRGSRKLTPRGSQQKSKRSFKNVKDVSFAVKKFQMSNNDYEGSRNAHIYTRMVSNKLERPLRLKPNASIQNRFPNLNDYLYETANQEDQIPILHNLVNLRLPHPSRCFNGQHDTTLEVELKNLPNDDEFGCITMIYSFGNEVIKLNDDILILRESCGLDSPHDSKNFVLQLNFAKDFWIAFFNSLEKNVSEDMVKCENQKTIAVKAITMKQIIFSKKRSSGFDKDDIRSIILWEFTRNEDSFETTSRRLYLPNTERSEIKFLSKLSEPVLPKDNSPIDYNDASSPHPHNAHVHHHHSIQEPEQHNESPHVAQQQLPQQSLQHHHHQQQQQLPPQHHSQQIQDDYEKDLEPSSANTTLQFDDFAQNEIIPITQPPSFRNNSVPVYLPPQHPQQHQFNPQVIQHPEQPVTQHHLRRFQSEPSSFWNLQHTGISSTSPQLSLQSTTTSTISSEGFNTDEFQGFNQPYSNIAPPTLNPGYIHFDQNPLKIEQEFSGEVFPTW